MNRFTDNDLFSHCSIALLWGKSVNVWTCPQTAVGTAPAVDTAIAPFPELALGLAPGRLVVIGRSSGRHAVPYLDPAYRATQIVPGSEQPVLLNDPADNSVSRAHFTLCGAAGGAVMLTNGVPSAGGGTRPPTNGTWLLSPVRRSLEPGEEVRLEPGTTAVIWLPNGCTLQLAVR